MEVETAGKRRFRGTIWFWMVMALVTIVALCAVAVLTDAAVYYNKVHHGVSVNGVDLGGETKGVSEATLNGLVDTVRATPITLTSGDKTWALLPDDAGMSVDVNGAVDAALAVTRENNLLKDTVKRFELFFDGRDLPLPRTVDQAKVAAVVSDIAAQLHVMPLNAGLALQDGQVKVIEGVDGRDVDQAALRSRLQALLLSMQSATVEVPVVVTPPPVQAKDNRAAEEQARTMLGSSITLTDRGKSWTLTPDQIASYMDFMWEYQDGALTLVPYLAQGKMWLYLDSLAPEVKIEPKSASLVSAGNAPKIIPGINGETLDATALVKALNAVAAKPTGRTLAVPVTVVEPEFTTAEAQAETFTDKLSSFSTTYACPVNRQINVKLATRYSTDVFLAPGQEFNFDKQIGPRIASRGWQLAPGITGPNTLDDVLGGGICQVSTTMFNAVFFAGLKVTERHNHSIFINHYPLGRDATVTGGGKNLRFVNDTDHYIWIRGTSTGTTTTITIWGASDGRKVSYSVGSFYNIKQPGPPITVQDPDLAAGVTKVAGSQVGRQLKTTRTVTMPDGTVLHHDVWTSTWPAYPQTTTVGTK